MKESLDIEVKQIEIDADHDDQAYGSKDFGLEAACPTGSPSERLRGCGLDISSYLLRAPSQVFMKPKMLLNCKLTDGNKSINVKAWTRGDDNRTDRIDDASPIDLCNYLQLNDEIENFQTYYIVTPGMENTQRTDENEEKICLKEYIEEINEQETKGKKNNEEKKNSRHFQQRFLDIFERFGRALKPKHKKKSEDFTRI